MHGRKGLALSQSRHRSALSQCTIIMLLQRLRQLDRSANIPPIRFDCDGWPVKAPQTQVAVALDTAAFYLADKGVEQCRRREAQRGPSHPMFLTECSEIAVREPPFW